MSESLMSFAGQLVGIPAEKYSGINGITVDQNNKSIGLDETVLFEDNSAGTLVANVVLSESSTHFSKLEITVGWKNGGGRIIFTCVPDGAGYGFAGYIGSDGAKHHVLGAISTSGTALTLVNCLDMYTSNNSSIVCQSFNHVLQVFKVVGIHRISGGNA
jgi:hypothetical protein